MSSMPSVSLRVGFATHRAAELAVTRWHYSKRLLMPPLVRFGVWENEAFIGVVLFGRGANPSLGAFVGLEMTQVCELVRVALRSHVTPVSRIVAIAVRMLRKHSPNLRLIVSYADEAQGHHGGIYQAMGWTYVGRGGGGKEYFHKGRWTHAREITSGAFGNRRVVQNPAALPSRVVAGKHKYVLALDGEMKRVVDKMAKPYPRPPASASSEAAERPSAEAGQH